MTTVTLDNSEYLHALMAGCLRRVSARQAKRQNYYGALSIDAEMLDIIGAVGEAIVAKHLDKFWCGRGKFRGGDVGDYQVRTTKYQNGHLLLNNNDYPDIPYILVTVNNGVGTICGWLYAKEGQRQEYWQDKSGRGGAYYVPQSKLRPIETLEQATRVSTDTDSQAVS